MKCYQWQVLPIQSVVYEMLSMTSVTNTKCSLWNVIYDKCIDKEKFYPIDYILTWKFIIVLAQMDQTIIINI